MRGLFLAAISICRPCNSLHPRSNANQIVLSVSIWFFTSQTGLIPFLNMWKSAFSVTSAMLVTFITINWEQLTWRSFNEAVCLPKLFNWAPWSDRLYVWRIVFGVKFAGWPHKIREYKRMLQWMIGTTDRLFFLKAFNSINLELETTFLPQIEWVADEFPFACLEYSLWPTYQLL